MISLPVPTLVVSRLVFDRGSPSYPECFFLPFVNYFCEERGGRGSGCNRVRNKCVVRESLDVERGR